MGKCLTTSAMVTTNQREVPAQVEITRHTHPEEPLWLANRVTINHVQLIRLRHIQGTTW